MIKRKFIRADAVSGDKILLRNAEAVRAQSASGDAVELLKLDAANVLQFMQHPRVSRNPISAMEVAPKGYVDSELSAVESALEAALSAAEAALTAETARALAAEQELASDIAAEEASRIASDEAETAARIAADSAEESARISADNALSGRIDALEFDSVTKAYVDAADHAIDLRLDVLEGDTATPGSVAKAEADAKAYADQKIYDLVNGAPAMLDTLKELADALGSDANFSATVSGYIAGLDMRLDVLEGDATIAGSVAHAVAAEAALREAADMAEAAARQAADEAEALARQAADEAEALARQAADEAEALARAAEDASIRYEFAAADSAVRSEFAAADQAVLNEAKAYTDESVGSVVQDVEIERQAREAEDLTFLKLDGSRPMESPLDMGGHSIFGIESLQGLAGISPILVQSSLDFMSNETVTGLREPEQDSDAATKLYVDQQNASQNQAASAAYAALQAAIDAETARAIAAEAAGQAYTDAEILEVIGGASESSNTLKKIEDRINFFISNTDPEMLDSLSEIVSAFQAADGNLYNAITSLASSLSAEIVTERQERIAADAAEAAARMAADESEAQARAAADSAEAQARQSADAAEAAARQAADMAEAAARAAADVVIQASVEEVDARLTTEIYDRSLAVSAEAQARMEADEAESAARQAADIAETAARIAGDAQTLVSSQQYVESRLETLSVQELAFTTRTLTTPQDLMSIVIPSAVVGTPFVMVDGLMARPQIDFTFSVSGSSTVITWTGEWAANSTYSPVEANDVVYVWYMVSRLPFGV